MTTIFHPPSTNPPASFPAPAWFLKFVLRLVAPKLPVFCRPVSFRDGWRAVWLQATGLRRLRQRQFFQNFFRLRLRCHAAAQIFGHARAGLCAAGFVRRARLCHHVEKIAFEILRRIVHAHFAARNVLADDFQNALQSFARQHRRRDAQRVRLGEQFLQRAGGLDFSAVINHHAVANVLDIGKQMAAQDHRLAAARERDDQILHFAAADRIKAGGRLIENHEVRIVDERLRQADAALHAFGKFADGARLRFAEADHFQKVVPRDCRVRFSRDEKDFRKNPASRAS